jgi:uncharacterized protein YjeT (DUF2065 family)
MTAADWLAAIGLLLVIEGILPFAAPALWRDGFRRILEFSNGQLRFIGAALGGPTRISRLRFRRKAMDARRGAQARVVPCQAAQRSRRAFLRKPEGTAAIQAHSFVASCLQ